MADTQKPFEGGEGDKKTQRISLDAVSEVIGKGDMVVHIRSGYDQKNIPVYFEYAPISPEVFRKDLADLQTSPKIFMSPSDTIRFIQRNSVFVTDTYVLNPPGTDIFFVYQLGNIRFFQDKIIEQFQIGPTIKYILGEMSRESSSVWDHHGVRKPEFIGRDDDGSKLPSSYIEPVLGASDQYITPQYSGNKNDISNPIITLLQEKEIKQ